MKLQKKSALLPGLQGRKVPEGIGFFITISSARHSLPRPGAAGGWRRLSSLCSQRFQPPKHPAGHGESSHPSLCHPCRRKIPSRGKARPLSPSEGDFCPHGTPGRDWGVCGKGGFGGVTCGMGISISGAERFLFCGHRASSVWIPGVPRVPPWSDAGKAGQAQGSAGREEPVPGPAVNDNYLWSCPDSQSSPGEGCGRHKPISTGSAGSWPRPCGSADIPGAASRKMTTSQPGITATHSGENSLCLLLGQAGLRAKLLQLGSPPCPVKEITGKTGDGEGCGVSWSLGGVWDHCWQPWHSPNGVS